MGRVNARLGVAQASEAYLTDHTARHDVNLNAKPLHRPQRLLHSSSKHHTRNPPPSQEPQPPAPHVFSTSNTSTEAWLASARPLSVMMVGAGMPR